jgi:hypothetical protein
MSKQEREQLVADAIILERAARVLRRQLPVLGRTHITSQLESAARQLRQKGEKE